MYARYRENLQPVLKGLHLNINSLEKIGICGRTGVNIDTLLFSIYQYFLFHILDINI